VVVTKLDRLGRSTRELLDLTDRISKVKPLTFVLDGDFANLQASVGD